MAGKGTSVKKRHWAFFVYPTREQLSAEGSEYDGSDGYGTVPDDWKQKLQLSGLRYAISPLHDKDELEDGSKKTKKPHYHVIVCYGSPTTYKNVKSLTDSLNAPIPQALEQVRGYYRYLTHRDNPEKYQYDEKEIQTGGGFDIANFVELSKSEVTEIVFNLQKLIREQGFIEYSDFMDYVQDTSDRLVYDVASSHTLFFNTYLRSHRHGMEQERQPLRTVKVDSETGEIVN
jgi:hypothetical protein